MLWIVAIFVFLVNLPFGYWRDAEDSPVEKIMRQRSQAADDGDMLETVLARLQDCDCHTLPVTRQGKLKMARLNVVFGGNSPIGWSLGIITALIAASVALSLVFPKRKTA